MPCDVWLTRLTRDTTHCLWRHWQTDRHTVRTGETQLPVGMYRSKSRRNQFTLCAFSSSSKCFSSFKLVRICSKQSKLSLIICIFNFYHYLFFSLFPISFQKALETLDWLTTKCFRAKLVIVTSCVTCSTNAVLWRHVMCHRTVTDTDERQAHQKRSIDTSTWHLLFELSFIFHFLLENRLILNKTISNAF